MSGTHLFYNGVLMQDCEILGWEQRLETDPSNVDVMFTRYRITVASSLISKLSTNPADSFPESSNTGTGVPLASAICLSHDDQVDWLLPDRLRNLREALESPRKDFWVAINGVTYNARATDGLPTATYHSTDSYRIILAATGLLPDGEVNESPTEYLTAYTGNTTIPRSTVIDFDNGPKPIDVKIAKLTGGRFMRVQFTIEVVRLHSEKVESDPESPPVVDAALAEGVVSNRWSISEAIDGNQATSFTIRGVLRVSDHRYKPYAYRTMCAQKLIPWAKIVSREYHSTEDGLSLHYSFVMKEIGIAAPPYTVDWGGTYTMRSGTGAEVYRTVSAKIRGNVNPPTNFTTRSYKVLLFDLLLRIVRSRIELDTRLPNQLPGVNNVQHILKDFTLVEDMKEPELSVTVTVLDTSDQQFLDDRIRVFQLGTAPVFQGYDPQYWPEAAEFPWDVVSMNDDRADFGSAYDMYLQATTDDWHGKPRGLLIDTDALIERGDTGLFVAPGAGGISTVSVHAVENDFLMADHNWSTAHMESGASYVQVELENVYESSQGKMVLPLSKPRDVSSEEDAVARNETLAIVAVHAGAVFRDLVMVARRNNNWPKIPSPATLRGGEAIRNDSGEIVGYEPRETLVETKIIPEAPKPLSDGKTSDYVVQCRYRYAVHGAPVNLRVARDPRVKPAGYSAVDYVWGDQRLSAAQLYDSTGIDRA